MAGDQPFKNPLETIRGYLDRLMDVFIAADRPAVPPTPALPEDDLEPGEPLQPFTGEMFARLLIELPGHRSNLAAAYQAGDLTRLKDHVHQLIGGASYCDTPELTTGLRELRLALKTEDPNTIEYYYLRAIDIIDATLRYSGYRG